MSRAGLSSDEAAARLAKHGRNELPPIGQVSVGAAVVAQLTDPLIMVLLAACLLTVVTGDVPDAAVILLVVVVNTTVGVAQQLRADREVTALAALTRPEARVRRDGSDVTVPSSELVPGDVVLLAEGDVVPADSRVIESWSLLVDESALTGESVPVGKAVLAGAPDGDARSSVSAGTVVVKGRATVVVTATGPGSALGRIASLLDTGPQATPLQRRLAALGRLLAIVAVALCGVVLVLGLARGVPLELMVVTAISLAVAAVPESLPAVVTLSLALGARRMTAREAIVRRLPAVETMGSVGVLATDKTGTLTAAQMVVREVWTPHRQVGLSGEGYEPRGEIIESGRVVAAADVPDIVDLLRAGALCNDAALLPPDALRPAWSATGDPTEAALLAAAAKAGIDVAALKATMPRVAEVPFDSVTARMTTVHRHDGRLVVVSKGSPEALWRRHGAAQHHGTWVQARRQAAVLADRGFRVLAIAASDPLAATGSIDAADLDRNLRLLGLVAMEDPAKPAAVATIDACRAAGIVPVLITGDHPDTARAIAARVGIIAADEPDRDPGPADSRVATGAQIAEHAVPDLTAARVFARTSPEQKLDIVQAWRDKGVVVAMTGDGVNDGPALRRADIGVAMGHRGTEVARQAADLVLADDELGTVVAAVEEGRRIYANIRRFLVFGLAGGAAEILLMLVGPLVGLVIPLLAAQILWINLLTHGLTGVAMGAEPAEPDVMRRPPRPATETVLGDGLWQRVLRAALVIGALALVTGLWSQATGRPWQTMVFLTLTTLQLGVAAGLRPRLLTRANPMLPTAIAGSLALALAGVYLPLMQGLLSTASLPWGDTALALALGAVAFGYVRLDRWVTDSRASMN